MGMDFRSPSSFNAQLAVAFPSKLSRRRSIGGMAVVSGLSEWSTLSADVPNGGAFVQAYQFDIENAVAILGLCGSKVGFMSRFWPKSADSRFDRVDSTNKAVFYQIDACAQLA